jgi:nucleotide-binding universal stress UspA family protein
MNAKKILFTTDYSHLSDAALAFATSFAKDSGGKLIIIHVQEAPVAYGGGEMYYGVPEPETEELLTMLQAVKPTDASVPYEHHLMRGDVAETVVSFAEDAGIDLIVLGSHGRTGLTRVLMGSVAEAIVRKAHCPVLVYKQPLKAETDKSAEQTNPATKISEATT